MISTQAARVNQHETSILHVMEHPQQLTASLTQLCGQMAELKNQLTRIPGAVTSSPPAHQQSNPASQVHEPYIPIPARYSGDLGTCLQFLHQCNLVFSQQPHTYVTSQSKIAFVMSLLTRQAAAWSLAISSQQTDLLNNYTQFTAEMRRVFDHPVKGRQAVGRLLNLKQGHNSVSEYAVNFRYWQLKVAGVIWHFKPFFLKGWPEK